MHLPPYRHILPLEMTMLAGTIGHTFGVKVQRVQRVQKVQRVVVATDAADYKKGARLRRRLCRRVVHPTGKTTHYILCVAPLLRNVFAVHRFRTGGGQEP